MSGEASEGPNSRLERELAYYRREVNQLGAQLIRLREEQQRTFIDAQRSRIVVNMVRELYRVNDRGGIAGTSLNDLVIEVVAASAMCGCAALFRESERGSGAFALAGAVGLALAERPRLLRLRRPPPFLFTTAATPPDPSAGEIAAFLGVRYILWSYDPGSGYALVLGNRSEANVNRPFELADQELIETALTVFLDAKFRVAQAPATPEEGEGGIEGDGEESGGLEGGDALKQQLRRGGRVLNVLVVERPSAEAAEYVAYLNVSWRRGWHVLRAYRDRGDRVYKHLNSLVQMVRSDLEFMGPVMVYAPDTPELERIPTITARERRQCGRVGDGSTNASAAASSPPPETDIQPVDT